LLDLFVSAFVSLFVVIDPPGCGPIFASLTTGVGAAQARSMALRATFIASLILLVFALFGEQLLAALHIELDAFRVAGGIMLFLIALEMVFEKRTQRREARTEKVRASPEIEDVAVFPMAIPTLAGPGSIATIMLLMARAEGTQATLIVLAALASVMLLSLFALLAAVPIMKLLGAQTEAVITRLLGVLLGALAAQYVLDGLKAAL